MADILQGTFHFHSTYSHDGRSTLFDIASALKRFGFSFCVMTDHFEDFDGPKFGSYLREIRNVTEKTDFCLIPGVEVNLTGVDTILFPARDYDEIVGFAAEGKQRDTRLCSAVAHASKYPFEVVTEHLDKYRIDGVEIWNQQADGSYMPPFKLLESWKSYSRRKQYHYFFGCDLHNVNLTVTNVLSVSGTSCEAEALAESLKKGNFTSRNLPTGVEYQNGSERSDYDRWLNGIQKRSYSRGRVLGTVRSGLKSVYKMLPRDAQKSLNNVKNYVRNKV